MNYQETLDYLYSRLPVFQNIGARAYKPGLHTTQQLCNALGNPQNRYPTIHVGGTNGKGSTSHMLAAILQSAGYKVGLYTSPHLKSFTERIKVNGKEVEENFIVKFIADNLSNIDRSSPSFFEVTVAMAFSYFAECEVDVAVIEVGMGGRMDSTNIINPILSVITNVSFDHTQYLGDTLVKIAGEKAGIIKPNTSVVISEHNSETAPVFRSVAQELDAPIHFASESVAVDTIETSNGQLCVYAKEVDGGFSYPALNLDLCGSYQLHNIKGVLTAVALLQEKGYTIQKEHVYEALRNVVKLTGLKGRWQQIGSKPLVYCDTAHNVAGLRETIGQLTSLKPKHFRFVIGFVGDKDIRSILPLFPLDATYYFTQPSNSRALPMEALQELAQNYGLKGNTYQTVDLALDAAIRDADSNDCIYVGGSTFVVADLSNL